MYLPPKKIGDGTKIGHGLGGTDYPFALQLVLRGFRYPLQYLKKPDFRVLGIFYFFFLILQSGIGRPLHIALSRSQPYFPDQYVPDFHFFMAFHHYAVAAPCLGGRQLQRPYALVGLGGHFFIVPGPIDRNLLAGSGGPSPDSDV